MAVEPSVLRVDLTGALHSILQSTSSHQHRNQVTVPVGVRLFVGLSLVAIRAENLTLGHLLLDFRPGTRGANQR